MIYPTLILIAFIAAEGYAIIGSRRKLRTALYSALACALSVLMFDNLSRAYALPVQVGANLIVFGSMLITGIAAVFHAEMTHRCE